MVEEVGSAGCALRVMGRSCQQEILSKGGPIWEEMGVTHSWQQIGWGAAAGLVLGGFPWMGTATAQDAAGGLGDPWITDSMVVAVLQSVELVLGPEDGRGLPGRLQYEIGFATREAAGIGFLYDSLTISLSRADGSGSIVSVTGDVFGLTIAPLAPGGLLAGGGIRVSEVDPRVVLLDGAPVSFAYAVEVQLPPALVSAELRTRFDFFNNGDAAVSRGYAMVVPEASTWVLGLVGAGLLWAGGRRRGGRS